MHVAFNTRIDVRVDAHPVTGIATSAPVGRASRTNPRSPSDSASIAFSSGRCGSHDAKANASMKKSENADHKRRLDPLRSDL